MAFNVSKRKIQIKPTFADFHFHSCSEKWFHGAWNRDQDFSALPCPPPDYSSFSGALLSCLLFLFCLKHWFLCFIWAKWSQGSHFLSWFCYLVLFFSLFFHLDSLLASTSSNDIIPGGGIYSGELRASKNTPKNTKIVPITFPWQRKIVLYKKAKEIVITDACKVLMLMTAPQRPGSHLQPGSLYSREVRSVKLTKNLLQAH